MQKGLSKALWFFIFTFYIAAFFHINYWQKAAYGGDSWGYYVHLPATFIYNDIGDYDKSFAAVKKYAPYQPNPKDDQYGVRPTPIGRFADKYSHGMAYLLLPFFAAAHLFCKITALYPADGFSMPYMLGIGLAVLFYVFSGLFLLKRLLNRYFTEGVVWATVFSLAIATNLLYFSAYNSIMSHGPLFACYCFLLYATDTFYRSPSRKWAILVGLAYGFVALIRMNELYAVFIPLFWGVGDWSDLKARFSFLYQCFSKYVVWAALPVILLFLPQFCYWKYVSNSWIYNAYAAEKFDFRHPQIVQGLFGFQNGWIAWTPIMAFALLGVFALQRFAKAAFLPTLLILPLHIYIIYSWWCWYYINGFGSRPMVEMYALLAFSLAAFYSLLSRLKMVGTVLNIAIVLFFSVFNIFKIYQEKEGLIMTQFSNRAFYWSMLTATKPSRESLAAWMSNETQPKNPTKIKDIAAFDFEDSTALNVTSAEHFSGKYSLISRDSTTHITRIPLSTEGFVAGRFVRISVHGLFHEQDRVEPLWEQTLIKTIFFSKENKKTRERVFGMQSFCGNTDFNIWSTGVANTWGEAVVFIKIPKNPPSEGYLEISVYNQTKRPFFIDDMKIELWKND